MPTSTALTHCPSCTKELTHDNCTSWSVDTGFHPRPCESCKRLACDDCSDCWALCTCCGGGICLECAVSTRSRSVIDVPAYGAPCRTRTEVLCASCAKSQDDAKQKLASACGDYSYNNGLTFSFSEDAWLSDIVSDLSDALRAAQDAL